MSLTLDVSGFLQADLCQNGPQEKQAHKECSSIFEEIEHLLKFNKNHDLNAVERRESKSSTATREPLPPPPPPPDEGTGLHLDFLPSACTTHDFLLPTDTQSLLGEDPLLYTVEQDRLQPISSPFMVPGIYKKIDRVHAPERADSANGPSNVFISECELHGRVVSRRDFHELYVCANELGEPPAMQPRKVILMELLESSEEESQTVVKPVIRTVKNNKAVPKQWDALNKLAYDILKLTNRDHIVIDRKRNEIVRTEHTTNQKTIYRFLAPEMLGLKPLPTDPTSGCAIRESSSGTVSCNKPKTKLGRPRKRAVEGDSECVTVLPKKRAKKTEKPNGETCPQAATARPQVRTRSGRLVKTQSTPAVETSTAAESAAPTSDELMRSFLADLRDSDYRCSKLRKEEEPPAPQTSESQSPSKRRVPPEAICPTCKKIFLGRRLQRHFAQHPDHIKVVRTTTPTPPSLQATNVAGVAPGSGHGVSEDMSLFRFLITKLQKSETLNEDQRADLFLAELNDLVEQLQLRSSRLIRNTSGLHFVNSRTARILGIPEGQYALDMAAIEAPLEPDATALLNFEQISTHTLSTATTELGARNLDYASLSMSLDDTLTDEAAQKLNLSAGGKLLPPSEESLLRAVDDLVHTDINKLNAGNLLQPPVRSDISMTSSASGSSVVANILPPHIDHVSDNAVEAVSMKETPPTVTQATAPLLDLSVDFFQFNN